MRRILVLSFVFVAFYFLYRQQLPETSERDASGSAISSTERAQFVGVSGDGFDTEFSNLVSEGALPVEENGAAQRAQGSSSNIFEHKTKAQKIFDAFSIAAARGNEKTLARLKEIGADCEWCGEFYSKVEEKASSPKLSRDEKGFFAKALAQSGRPESVSKVIEMAQTADPQDTTLYTRPLKDAPLTPELIEEIDQTLDDENVQKNGPLSEALVSALTRDGSLFSIQTLYNNAIETENPDGYYRIGIGLGELTPDSDPNALAFLADAAAKGDEYSHLALKALINQGKQGLEMALDVLENTDPAVLHPSVLRNAVSHVDTTDSDALAYIQQKRSSSNPLVSEFAKEVIKEHKIDLPGQNRDIRYTDTFEEGIVLPQQ
ncbi:MAG: hypothetical protein KDD42_05065 [Bdellovibrionales bacterium]|nr:hypothetical protein [Bdellovibrionales bacterium]